MLQGKLFVSVMNKSEKVKKKIKQGKKSKRKQENTNTKKKLIK